MQGAASYRLLSGEPHAQTAVMCSCDMAVRYVIENEDNRDRSEKEGDERLTPTHLEGWRPSSRSGQPFCNDMIGLRARRGVLS